jgi:sodium-dependent dicarboxylate transporter 2/3/5
MWISNTATTMMMLPIALAVANKLDPLKDDGTGVKKSETKFGLSLMLAIAFSASIGGLSTLIGTPTNAMFAAVVKEIYDVDIDFAIWFRFALPISSILLIICWVYLVKFVYPVKIPDEELASDEIEKELNKLGGITTEEKRVTVVFALTAIAWMLRSLVLKKFIPHIDDTIIAMSGALILFLIPSTKKGKMLMDWSTAKRLPWGILILFGGGLSIAAAFQSSGLAHWMGNSLQALQNFQLIVVLFIVALLVNALTEFTSNVATASIILPILASLAAAIHLHPYMLMVVATLVASCAFMLPVATPPNAVVFSSGYIRIRDMARTGVGMNLISIVIAVLIVWFFLPIAWGIDPYGTL